MRFAHTTYDEARGIEMRLFGLQANGIQIATVLRQSITDQPDNLQIVNERFEDGLRIIEVAAADGRFLAEARITQGEIAISNRQPDGTFSGDTRDTVAHVMELTIRKLAERLHMTEFEMARDLTTLLETGSA